MQTMIWRAPRHGAASSDKCVEPFPEHSCTLRVLVQHLVYAGVVKCHAIIAAHGVSCDTDDAPREATGTQLARGLRSRHVGHLVVHDDQVKVLPSSQDQIHGRRPILRVHAVHADGFEEHQGERQVHDQVVLGVEDSNSWPSARVRDPFWPWVRRRLRRRRCCGLHGCPRRVLLRRSCRGLRLHRRRHHLPLLVVFPHGAVSRLVQLAGAHVHDEARAPANAFRLNGQG
mmetsp:Transcript_14001/g.37674  ORF Transcript_14001/g.37674 Transcript_14001/m.37674 type:complete len:229 (-) Transcript_14001:184-870(-)